MRTFENVMSDLVTTSDKGAQLSLIEELGLLGADHRHAVFRAQQLNTFLHVDSVEGIAGNPGMTGDNRERGILSARLQAAGCKGQRIAVFSMPKSGSSFIQSAIQSATSLPFVSLVAMTARGAPPISGLGINGREQEIDELAVILQTLRENGSWVAQHHTRFTPFLGDQLRFFGIKPIITIRNIFDTIVSMDDMIVSSRPNAGRSDWTYDPYFPIPSDYSAIDREERLSFLCSYFGKWQVNFFLSWMRGIRENMIEPLVVQYERHIVGNRHELIEDLANFCAFNAGEVVALLRYIDTPDKKRARLNKGQIGRGEDIPSAAKDDLMRYYEMFAAESRVEDFEMLFS